MLAKLLEPCLRSPRHFRGKGRLLRWWMKLVANQGIRTRALPGGGRLQCDMAVPYEAMIWLEKEEEGDLATLRRLLHRGETFVDCGANVGLWTLVASHEVGVSGRVFAYEPNAATRRKLARSLQENRVNNVTVVPAAVGDRNASVLLKCEAAHNISRVVADPAGATEVPLVTLDSELGGQVIHGCKIDVEGYELNVLQGARAILAESRPWLAVEFNTILAESKVLGDWPVHQYLSSLGYAARLFADALNPSASVLLPNDWQTEYYCNLFYAPAASSHWIGGSQA